MHSWKQATYYGTQCKCKDLVELQVRDKERNLGWLVRRLFESFFWVKILPVFVITINGKINVKTARPNENESGRTKGENMCALFILRTTRSSDITAIDSVEKHQSPAKQISSGINRRCRSIPESTFP